MKELETDAIPRPTKNLLDDAIDGIFSKMTPLSIAAYQEMRNGRIEVSGQIAVQLEAIRRAISNLREIRGKL